MPKAGLDKNPREIAAMFDAVARRYDCTNTVLSFGQDRGWRVQTRRALSPKPGERILDLAAGTGVSTREFARSGAWCVAADLSQGMLLAGASREGGSQNPEADAVGPLPRVAADGLALPFGDGVFDGATISFGLRNLVDPVAGLRELHRVVRPGGRLVVCEFSTPTWRPFRVVYQNYLMRALPLVARKVASNPEAYEYLADSIRAWPDQHGLAEKIAEAGWRSVVWRNLTGGIVALHRATRPE